MPVALSNAFLTQLHDSSTMIRCAGSPDLIVINPIAKVEGAPTDFFEAVSCIKALGPPIMVAHG